MKSFRRASYKMGELFEEKQQISCNSSLRASGNEGIYEVEINIGTETGTTGIIYEAFTLPDRFQIFFDGDLVADSKYVGGGLDGLIPQLKGTYTLPILRYEDGSFVDSGATEEVTVVDADMASGSTEEPKEGRGQLTFEKTKDTVTSMKLRVFGVLETTIWNISPICPYTSGSTTPPPTVKTYDMMFHANSTGDCEEMENGVSLKLYNDSDLTVGESLYSNMQLTQKAKGGEYWLGRTIYIVDFNGIITDFFPCHRGTGI